MLSEEAFQRLLLTSSHAQHFEHRFGLAGLDVCLHSSVERLADLFYRPFCHLPVLESKIVDANLDVEIISGVPRPQVTSSGDGTEFLRGVGGHRIQASPDGRFVCHEVLESNSLWCLDRYSSRIIGWVESPDRVTLYERAKPFVNLLPFIVERFERYMFHAALVSWRGRGILFVGPGGAGKSTSALSCLLGGLDFISEDLVVLEEKRDGFVGHGVYNAAWIAPDHLPRFGDLTVHAHTGGEVERHKNVLMLAEIFPGRLRASAPLHFMFLPRIRAGAASTVMPAGKPEALKQLAPNCLMTASRIDKTGFESLVRLVKGTRCCRLELGDDLERVPQLVRETVERDV